MSVPLRHHDIAELRDGLHAAARPQGHLGGPGLDAASGDFGVLRLERARDIRDRQVVRLEARRIERDVDLPLPPAGAYEGFAVAEDGIGLVRRFEDAWARALRRRLAPPSRPRRVTVVTGELFAPRMRALLAPLHVPRLTVEVQPIRNELFGRGIGVAGLLSGRDIQLQLGEAACGGPGLGDEIVVRIVLRTDRDMEYVHLKDHRGECDSRPPLNDCRLLTLSSRDGDSEKMSEQQKGEYAVRDVNHERRAVDHVLTAPGKAGA